MSLHWRRPASTEMQPCAGQTRCAIQTGAEFNRRVERLIALFDLGSTKDDGVLAPSGSGVLSSPQIWVALRGFMKHAALGFRAHSGWTALVALSIEDGSPRILFRGRPHLVNSFTFEFRQPYHTAERRKPAEAHDIISRARAEAHELACQAILSAQGSLQHQGYELNSCGLLLASGRPLPDLPRILASHALIHTADGELFRDALLRAAERSGLEMFTVKESELFDCASRALGLEKNEVVRRVAQIGQAIGPPWTQDEKLSALIAWLSLEDPASLSLGSGRNSN